MLAGQKTPRASPTANSYFNVSNFSEGFFMSSEINSNEALQSKHATVPPEIEGMPPGIPYIVGNEAAERFSFYGMKAILMVFMTKYLIDATGQPAHMDKEAAKIWYHNFTAAVYFFPILGAFISDWLVGKYRMIISLSIVYCLGHGVLAMMDLYEWTHIAPRNLLFLGLVLIAIGSGGIKPCVSAHVGDQFGHRNHHLVSRVFGWFYFAINFGSMLSTLLIPYTLKHYGAGWAFGIPGILMSIATFVFWLGRHKYVHVPASGNRFFKETFSKEGLRAIGNLIPLYIFIAMFWALFDQTGSAWVLQAEQMDRTLSWIMVDTPVLNNLGEPTGELIRKPFEVLPSQLQALNPFLVMILIPLFSYGLYPFLGKFFKVTPLRKVGIGLFIMVVGFALTGIVEVLISQGKTPHIVWHFWAYVVITCAEVMISITCLEFSYTQAPPKMKSFIMGLYLLSVAFGNLFTAQVNYYISASKKAGSKLLDGANYYWFFSIAMLITAVLFVIWSQFYKGHRYVQGDSIDELHEESEAEGSGR